MYFTREPIVETVITPKEGHKLVLRNCRTGGQEEYFVDAVEVISFGEHCFYRSLEKPKAFLLPVSEYEIVEVREPKLVLKGAAVERGIKIGGGREVPLRRVVETKEEGVKESEEREPASELKNERRRRRFRKRKEGEPVSEEETPALREEKVSLIPPPTTLISETISRYKDLPVYAGAFFDRTEKEEGVSVESDSSYEAPTESSEDNNSTS